DKPSTAYVDEVITYLYNADDRITSELLDKQNNGTTDQTTTYAWSGTRQSSKTVVIPSTSTVTQTFSYTLPGMLSRVVTENKNGSNVVTSRTRVDYDYTSTGIRSLSVDWNDANLNNSFATSEKTGSVEYLVDSTNHTGYAQTIVETTKNAAGVATKRIVYTYGSDEISQTTYLPPAGGGASWNAGTTLTFSHDAHTSVRMLTDAAGAIAQAFTYAAYGELIAIHNRIAQSVGTVGAQGLQSQALTSLLYNGESFDSRIGQLYLRARWYDGHRFTTLDPYFGNGSDPLSFNKYGFVHANPVMGIDPTGLEFSIAGLLSSIGIQGGQRSAQNSGNISALKNAHSAYKLIKTYQKVLKLYDKLESIYSWAVDILDLLDFGIEDVREITQNLGNVKNIASSVDTIIGRPQITIDLPRNALEKFHKLSGKVFHAKGASESTAMQEITGEIATALLVNLLGFTQSPFNWYWHGSKGPDQVGRHGSAGVWGIFEAKGGSNPLGITQQWGQQMGQRWLEHYIGEIYKRNSGQISENLRSQFLNNNSMLAMVVRLNLTPSKGEIQITYQKFNKDSRMHPCRNA
ncbi:MAG: RHS repeat-associated core domain-containing protein, partial [Pirellula sp.]